MADKRRATYILNDNVRGLVEESFRTQTAMLNALSQNAKTGPKIVRGEPVKREQMKSFVIAYLDFLNSWKDGKILPDAGKFFPNDVQRAVDEIVGDEKNPLWESLCHDTESVDN